MTWFRYLFFILFSFSSLLLCLFFPCGYGLIKFKPKCFARFVPAEIRYFSNHQTFFLAVKAKMQSSVSILSFIIETNLIFVILISVSVASFRANSEAAATYSNKTDQIALIDFKNLITGDPNGILGSWNDSVPLCNWFGVKCGCRHRRVVELDLSSQRLTGSISPSIGNLTFLRSIYLQNNLFQGNIPQQLGHLSRLQNLNFTKNTLQGEIPSNLSQCFELRTIDLGFNDLVGRIPASFCSLAKLTHLSFFSNNLHGSIPSSLGNLSLLQKISVGDNRLHGSIPDSIGSLTNLQFFGIGLNNISGEIPVSLYNISSIEDLVIPSNQLTGSLPSDIGLTLPNLKVISVGNNRFRGRFPISFSNVSGMRELDLVNNTFYGSLPIDLGRRMRDLQRLNLGKNNLGTGNASDLTFVESLTNCTNLQLLALNENGFGGVLSNYFTNLSTSLTWLTAGENRFTGNIPSGMSKFENLVKLTLEDNFLSASIPSTIGKLYSLEILSLWGNELSGPIPDSVGNLTRLFDLDFTENYLTGNIPQSLTNLLHLQNLYLQNNSLGGSIPSTIWHLPLLSMSFSYNSFNGSLPQEIGNLINLHEADFSDNKLSGKLPSSIGNCLILEHLYLSGNSFHGNIPPSFGSLKGIINLDLSRNNLFGRIPLELEKLSYLQNLNLSFNNLEGELPSKGVFNNKSVVSIVGNKNLCGGLSMFHLPACVNIEFKKQNRRVGRKVVLTIISLGIFLLLFLVVVAICWKKKTRKSSILELSLGEEFLRVSYDELFKATDGFSSNNLIGAGSFGFVYKGMLQHVRKPVAVKVLNLEQLGAPRSFIRECETLRRIRHRNLLKIITACSSVNFEGDDFKALVFDFMPNGSLEKWLHPDDDVSKNLALAKRLNIAVDIILALEYLHHDCETPIAHCDLKPSNVLLDEDMTAHVGDFGLAKFLAVDTSNPNNGLTNSIALKGSIGYVAPEYGMGGLVSAQGDVYSFGVLLLEMLTGKSPTDEMFKEGLTLHDFCKVALPGCLKEIVDSSLQEELNGDGIYCRKSKVMECLISLVRIGVVCSSETASERMKVKEIVKEMNVIKEVYLGVGVHGRRRMRSKWQVKEHLW